MLAFLCVTALGLLDNPWDKLCDYEEAEPAGE